MNIVDPRILVHEPNKGQLEILIGANEGETYEMFGVLIADVIRHVARGFNVEPSDVHERVQDELDNPTRELTGSGIQ